MAPFTREEFEHLFLFRIPLIGISVPFLPPGKGFPGKSGLMESAHVEKQPDESAFPYHFLISSAEQPNVIKHLRQKASNVSSSTEAKEVNV
jgi:hypothetical protein